MFFRREDGVCKENGVMESGTWNVERVGLYGVWLRQFIGYVRRTNSMVHIAYYICICMRECQLYVITVCVLFAFFDL